MRLLYIASDGRLSWTSDLLDNQTPPYAILSHVWEGQEVAYGDLQNHKDIEDVDARLKGGYQKIFFCATQAKRDGLDHFWVDTCCIDKANSTELSKAINSMFRWYQKAKKCYVFLSDVNDDSSEFRQSRWFNRGWTLQELLAPHSVEFFSRSGARLGDKASLEHLIHDITGVPAEALSGSDLSRFDVAERFSWATNRQTTEEEDGAYCLFGIFGVHLPLIYGEGKENAFERLRGAAILKHKGRSHDQEERLGKICSWLSAPDPSTNYHKAHKQRQADTGLWLLDGPKFTEWKERAASRLWLYGIPGCGKTILSSTIVEHLLQHCHDASMAMAYFYFDFNDAQKQDPELMIRSLLCQLLQQLSMISNGVNALFSSCGNGDRQPSLHALLEVIPQVMQQFIHVYIVLDALDECTQRPELMDVLETVAGWQLDNMHLLVTSRKERDIESSLENYVKEEDTVCLQRDVVDKDIQRYVTQRLSDDKALAKWNKDAVVKQEIEASLTNGARGMFRWAACQLDTLAKCRNRAMLRKSLATLPQTLDQTYDRILTAISEEDYQYAMRILQWLTFSARPLSVEEIAEVVAIDIARNPAFDRDEVLEDPLEALNICSSLVTIVTNKQQRGSRPAQSIIALAHYSVREYLVSNRIKQGQAKRYSMQELECHSAITKGCLRYLTQLQYPVSTETPEGFALGRYAAEFWSSHLKKTGDKTEDNLLAMSLMSTDNPAYINWVQLWNPHRIWGESDFQAHLAWVDTPLYYAAYLGLNTITRLLLDKGADIDVDTGVEGTALQAASAQGHEQVVKTLLDEGANVNKRSGHFWTALYAASEQGHKRVVEMLLDAGAEVDAFGTDYNKALHAASANGYKEIVELLLGAGANVNGESPGFNHTYALQAASAGGRKEVIELLLSAGADINAQTDGRCCWTALQQASLDGREQVVQFLLDKGADINAPGGPYGNALQTASFGDNEQVVKILLDRGADVNAEGGDCGNALQTASYRGYEQVVKILLDRGANVNAQGGPYSNALQAASYRGNEQIVKILLDKGANVNAQGGKHGNALQTASCRGYEQVVRILLDKGANVNAQGGKHSNALQAASLKSEEQIVKILLDKDANVNAQGGKHGNALQAASCRGNEQVVKILLDRGANIDAQGGEYGNALQAASAQGHEQVVKLLLDRDADVNAEGGDYGDALQAASYRGYDKIVKLLLDKGAKVNIQDTFYGDALYAASCGGHEQTVKLLLDRGADVNAQGGGYKNALQVATVEGHEQVVKMLLDAGAYQPEEDNTVE